MSMLPLVFPQFLDSNGKPVSNGKLYFYAAGTSTPLASYSDSALTTPNTNPVILDSGGFADIFLLPMMYKVILKDSNDNLLRTKDNVGNDTSGFSTGDVKPTFKITADSGWMFLNDTSIGSASSAATGRANADTLNLYSLFWNNISNTICPVSSGRGASAAADFAANKTLTIPKVLGRALASAGAGSGLTSRDLGDKFGEENHALTSAENATHTHIQDAHAHTVDAHYHQTLVETVALGTIGLSGSNSFANLDSAANAAGSATTGGSTGPNTSVANVNTMTSVVATNQTSGLGTAHNNMQPSTFMNFMVKL